MSRAITLAWAALALAVVAAAAIYRPGLGGPMVIDDFPVIGPLLDDPQADWSQALMSHAGPGGRALAMASFVADARLHGGDLAGWKATNVALHVATGVLLAVLGWRLGRRTGLADGAATWLGVAVAALWLLHPAQVSTVLYTVQRMTILAALLTVAALTAFVRGRELAPRSGGRAWRWYLAAFGVLWPLAVLAKESAVLLPLLAWVVELCGPPGPHHRRWLWGLGCLGLAVLAGGVVWSYGPTLAGMEPVYAARGYGITERLLTEARVMVRYMGQVLLPLPAWLGFVHDDLAVSRGLLQPPATGGALVVLVLVAAVVVALRRRLPLVAAGLGVFLVGHLLEGSIVPLELMFEHRNYLPSWGVLLACGAALAALPVAAGTRAGVTVAAAALLAAITLARAGLWGDELALYQSWYRHHPGSDRAAAALAGRLTQLGRAHEARALLRDHGSPGATLQGVYLDCRLSGRADPARLVAVAQGSRHVEVESYLVSGVTALANEVLDGRCAVPPAALSALIDALLARPISDPADRYRLLVFRAHLLHDDGRRGPALAALEQAVALRPRDPVPLFLATEWLIDAGDLERAATYYRRAVALARADRARYRGYVDDVGRRLAAAGGETEGAWTPAP